MKIVVAMSGGVDSSVAAAMLAAKGHDVTGVHLRLASLHGPAADGRVHGCCGVTDADDARRVAQVLDIPFYVWNLTEEFGASVVRDFVHEYERGRTPNPCVRCNETIKFGTLLRRARALGFDALATGHYAIARDGRLFRALDREKDQSYVLARTTPDQLAHAMFPLGEQTKAQTRETARALSLRTADKPESFEICFVDDGDTRAFVERALGPRPGELVDPSGAVVGRHTGVHGFTIGQRRGLGVASHERLHVLDIDSSSNRVVVGPAELLARGGLVADDARWLGDPARADAVQVRAHGTAIPATATATAGGRVEARFAEPVRGIAPGQLVAFYAGSEVLGGATIERALPVDGRDL